MEMIKIMKKYSLNEYHLDIIATAMMEGLNLTETCERLRWLINQDQLFSVANIFSQSEFGESIDELSPAMMIEKIEINESQEEDKKEKIIAAKEMRKRRAMFEDMLLCQAEKLLREA